MLSSLDPVPPHLFFLNMAAIFALGFLLGRMPSFPKPLRGTKIPTMDILAAIARLLDRNEDTLAYKGAVRFCWDLRYTKEALRDYVIFG